MSTTIKVPGDLTPILRREAVRQYTRECENAARIADRCIHPSGDLPELARLRARVVDAEAMLELVGDDVTTSESLALPLAALDKVEALAGEAIESLIADRLDMSPDEEGVVEVAEKIGRLRGLFEQAEAATA